MRVALVYPRHAATGGVERNLDHLARWLAEAGHRVDILCRRHGTAPHPGVGFVRLRPFAIGAAWRAHAFATAVAREVERGGYDRVLAFGRTWPHDAIRLGMGCHAAYVKRMGLTLGWRDRVEIRLENRSLAETSFRRGRKVVVNSHLVAAEVAALHGIPPAQITVVHNGTDLTRFNPDLRSGPGLELRRSCGFSADDRVVLFLGSGYARKGLAAVLDAVDLAPDLRLIVVGADGHLDQWKRRALPLGKRVAFLGERTDAQVCYAAADVFALPTRYDPFANATLEALASGVPVVTSDGNGGAEVVDPGVGAIVPVDAPANALAAALDTWAGFGRDPAIRAAARMTAELHPIAGTIARTAEILLA